MSMDNRSEKQWIPHIKVPYIIVNFIYYKDFDIRFTFYLPLHIF